jgi:hypothetical protein
MIETFKVLQGSNQVSRPLPRSQSGAGPPPRTLGERHAGRARRVCVVPDPQLALGVEAPAEGHAVGPQRARVPPPRRKGRDHDEWACRAEARIEGRYCNGAICRTRREGKGLCRARGHSQRATAESHGYSQPGTLSRPSPARWHTLT